MNKKLLYAGLISCIFCTTAKSFWPQIPTNFALEAPTNFTITTALDNLSVPKICQTASFLTGLLLVYKACILWAQAATPVNEQQDETTRTLIMKQKIEAALRYLLSGSTFVAASLLIQLCSTHNR